VAPEPESIAVACGLRLYSVQESGVVRNAAVSTDRDVGPALVDHEIAQLGLDTDVSSEPQQENGLLLGRHLIQLPG